MLQKAVLIISLSVFLAACGGDDISDFVEVSDIRLLSLEVVEGGTLLFEENEVEEFDPGNIGPYRVELADQSLTSITIRAGIANVDGVRLELVEFAKGDEDDDRVTAVSPNEIVTVSVEEGANLVAIRVSSLTSAARIDYVMRINKISSSAVLSDILVFGVRSSNESSNVQFSNEVAADIFEYDVTLSSLVCNAGVRVEAESRYAEILVNSERQTFGQETFFPLEEQVVLPVEVQITAEDGTPGQIYTFNLMREAATPEEINTDSFLQALTFSEGRATDEFRCNNGDLTQLISEPINSIAVTAIPSRAGASMTLGTATIEGVSVVVDEESLVTLMPGEPFTGELLSGLESGFNLFGLTVTAEDTESQSVYLINILRSENNEVYVTNTVELQQALRSALPNDEIVIAPGDYLGEVSDMGSLTGSGHPDAHFYTDVSGGEDDQSIVLRTESGDVTLLGDDLNQSAVLRIEGDNWRIVGIDFSGAQNGVVLDGVDNVLLESVSIEDVGERALVVQNASSNNQIRGSFIDRTGLSPENRDGVTEVYGEAIVIGDSVGGSENNSVRSVLFGRNIATEAVDIKAGSTGTAIQYSLFDLDNTLAAPFPDRTTILVGGSAEISYNQFEFNFIASGTDDIAQIVSASAAGSDVVEVYENRLELDDQPLTFVNSAGAAAVQVAANFIGDRVDGVQAIVTGNVDDGFSTPSFQLQSNLDQTKCLARRDVDVTISGVVDTLDLVVAADCENDPSQQWVFIHDEDGFVMIGLASNPAIKMRSVLLQGLSAIPTAARVLDVREDDGNNFDGSFFLRWSIAVNDGKLTIASRAQPGFLIIEDGAFEITDVEFEFPPVFVSPRIIDVSGEFTPVRL